MQISEIQARFAQVFYQKSAVSRTSTEDGAEPVILLYDVPVTAIRKENEELPEIPQEYRSTLFPLLVCIGGRVCGTVFFWEGTPSPKRASQQLEKMRSELFPDMPCFKFTVTGHLSKWDELAGEAVELLDHHLRQAKESPYLLPVRDTLTPTDSEKIFTYLRKSGIIRPHPNPFAEWYEWWIITDYGHDCGLCFHLSPTDGSQKNKLRFGIAVPESAVPAIEADHRWSKGEFVLKDQLEYFSPGITTI